MKEIGAIHLPMTATARMAEKDCIKVEIVFTFPVEEGESYDEANDRLTGIFDDLGLEYEQEDCWFHEKE